jgi:ATP-dependent DNA ligase
VDGDSVMLLSRNGADITRTFPEISAGLIRGSRRRRVVLDGEIVVASHTFLHRRGVDGGSAPVPSGR